MPLALAFLTWGYALARMNAGRLSVTTYLVPPITIVLSALILREWPPVLAIAGGLVCLLGVGADAPVRGAVANRDVDLVVKPRRDALTRRPAGRPGAGWRGTAPCGTLVP